MPPKPKQTRNRITKPTWAWRGLTADGWRASTDHVRWAQTDPGYRDLVTVLVNERAQALAAIPGHSENRGLGRIEGFEIALDVLRSLAQGTVPPPRPEADPEYKTDTATTTDSDFVD